MIFNSEGGGADIVVVSSNRLLEQSAGIQRDVEIEFFC